MYLLKANHLKMDLTDNFQNGFFPSQLFIDLSAFGNPLIPIIKPDYPSLQKDTE